MDLKGGVVGIRFILKYLCKHPRPWRPTTSFRKHFVAVGDWARSQIRRAFFVCNFLCEKQRSVTEEHQVNLAIMELCQSKVKTLQKFWTPALSTVWNSNFRIFQHHIKKKVWTRYSATSSEHYIDGGLKSRYNWRMSVDINLEYFLFPSPMIKQEI
jgi:hypothetical protein